MNNLVQILNSQNSEYDSILLFRCISL